MRSEIDPSCCGMRRQRQRSKRQTDVQQLDTGPLLLLGCRCKVRGARTELPARPRRVHRVPKLPGTTSARTAAARLPRAHAARALRRGLRRLIEDVLVLRRRALGSSSKLHIEVVHRRRQCSGRPQLHQVNT